MSAVSQFPPAHLISEERDEKDVNDAQIDGCTLETGKNSGSKLALPAPIDERQSAQSGGAFISSMSSDPDKEGGDTFTFDKLGPMVVNQDGTLSRIHNWADMSQAEQERTLRVINKRNQTRLHALKKELEERGEEEDAVR